MHPIACGRGPEGSISGALARRRGTGHHSPVRAVPPSYLPRVALVAIAAIGCGGAPDARVVLGPEAPKIDEIEFVGVERFSAGAIIGHLHIAPHSWLPTADDHRYDPALMAVDVRRIEDLYGAHGYHAARVAGVEVLPDGDDSVDLRITVVEGQPTVVRSLRFEWATDSTLDPTARPEIERKAAVRVQAPFEVGQFNDTLGTLRLALEAWGYPLARVAGRADVFEDARRADVRVQIDPGPLARVGAIRIDGLVGVPEDLVRTELRFALGEVYSPQIVRSVEDVLKGMDVFRWVAVRPGSEVVDGLVDLRVRVAEADPQALRLGLQLGFDSARWDQQLLARYSHANLGGRLYRLDLDVLLGWAELPDPFSLDAHGPAVAVEPTFTKKGLLEDELLWALAPAYALDIRQGYTFQEPRNRLSVARWLGRRVRGELSHTVRYFDFLTTDAGFDPASSQLGAFDFRDPYLLSEGALRLDFYWLDNVHQPADGAAVTLEYTLAGGPLQGDYDFHKWTAEWRGYWRPFARLQTAARIGGGGIVPYGERPDAPVSRRFYLGGPTTVRGWGARRLSPRSSCPAEVDPDTPCKPVPIGGFSMIQGNVELRLALFADISLVGFFDVGDVQAAENTWTVADWNYSAGPGLRYDSPVGLFRLDAGFRLNDPGVYDEPPFALYFGLGETF